MKKLKLVCLLFFCGTFISLAQSNVSDAYARITPQISTNTFDCAFTVEVSDTITTSAIEVKLGSADGLSNLVNHTFNYDVNSGLPLGYAWFRNGNTCTLNVGAIIETNTLFGEVRIQRPNGSWSSPFKFISN